MTLPSGICKREDTTTQENQIEVREEIHQMQGEYNKALEYYNKSLEIKERIYDMQYLRISQVQ